MFEQVNNLLSGVIFNVSHNQAQDVCIFLASLAIMYFGHELQWADERKRQTRQNAIHRAIGIMTERWAQERKEGKVFTPITPTNDLLMGKNK